jgi:hypothetical protein
MKADLFHLPDAEPVHVFYPTHGRSNVLRRVKGVKLRSYNGPGGDGITVKEENGNIRSLTLRKCVVF